MYAAPWQFHVCSAFLSFLSEVAVQCTSHTAWYRVTNEACLLNLSADASLGSPLDPDTLTLLWSEGPAFNSGLFLSLDEWQLAVWYLRWWGAERTAGYAFNHRLLRQRRAPLHCRPGTEESPLHQGKGTSAAKPFLSAAIKWQVVGTDLLSLWFLVI